MKNKKGFSLVELIVAVAIVSALSIYFYKIIFVLYSKYNEISKEQNNIVNETYITRLIYNALNESGNIWSISAAQNSNEIVFADGTNIKKIQISNMKVNSAVASFNKNTFNDGNNFVLFDLNFGSKNYKIYIYYYKQP